MNVGNIGQVATANQIERYEAKYLIEPSLVPQIRQFIAPFCVRDQHAKGEIPEYLVTTLQLDTPDMALYRAKEEEAINRFKLRVRSYGDQPATSPVFLEIKRKIKGVIVKSRATLSPLAWNQMAEGHILGRRWFAAATRDEVAYLEFLRLMKELAARPTMLIRYTRESYVSRDDYYSRVTFDRRLLYRPTNQWTLWEPDGWWTMDTATALNRRTSAYVLEVKTLNEAPRWMVDMSQYFDLVRVGFCKYYTAMRMNSLSMGNFYSDGSEHCLSG